MNAASHKRVKLRNGIAVIAWYLALAACANLQVSVDYDPAARLTELQTYAWKPEPQEKAGDTLVDSDTLLRQRVIRAIDAELARKGYLKVRSQPDFLVGFYFTHEQQVDESTYVYPFYGSYLGGPYFGYWGGWYYPGYFGYGGGYLREYTEGLLVIDLVAPDGHTLLWRGKVKQTLRFDEAPDSKTRRIQKAVSAVLERFPPKPSSP